MLVQQGCKLIVAHANKEVYIALMYLHIYSDYIALKVHIHNQAH